MPPVISLSPKTQAKLGVTEVHRTFSGGQKYVFIATCNGSKCAIKMFRYGFGQREKRELEFYIDKRDLEGIPSIIEVINDGQETIVVEEYINGQCLHDILNTYKKKTEEIVRVITGIIDILRPIWAEGKTHRDLKPQNIIIKPDGTPTVLDFGIFKDPESTTITDTGFQPHSWAFAAPEQHLGKKEYISYRTDFFALGVIAYHLYYQKLPFGQEKDEILVKMISNDLSFHTETSCPLNKFFESTFKLDVSERPRNTELLKEALTQ
jgi:serine/threonine-protein kinase